MTAEVELRFDLAAAFLGVQHEGGHHAFGVARFDLPGLHLAADLIQGRLEPVRTPLQGAARREKCHVVREEGDKRLWVAGPDSVVDVVAIDEPEEGASTVPWGRPSWKTRHREADAPHFTLARRWLSRAGIQRVTQPGTPMRPIFAYSASRHTRSYARG